MFFAEVHIAKKVTHQQVSLTSKCKLSLFSRSISTLLGVKYTEVIKAESLFSWSLRIYNLGVKKFYRKSLYSFVDQVCRRTLLTGMLDFW